MQITLWSFQKRKNSTKVPASAGTVVTCTLKEATSVMNPHFILSSSPVGYNYLQWGSAYYFIADVVFVHNGVWEISCDLDVLATHSATIKATTAFIEYADSYDARIYDPRLAKKINATEITQDAALPWYNPYGYCVVNVIGAGTCGSYAMDLMYVDNLMDNCVQWWSQFEQSYSWGSFEEAIKNTCALLITGDAASQIKSCRWIPGTKPSGSSQSLYAGLFDTGVSGIQIDIKDTDDGFITVSVPHPSNVMLRTSSTCEYTLYLPFVGTIAISADILADESSIIIDYSLALASGDLGYTVKTASGKYIGSYGTNVACDVPIGSAGVSARSMVTSVGAAAAALATGGAAIGAAETAGAAIGAGATTALKTAAAGLLGIQGTASSVGGVGGIASLGLSHNVHLTCSYWDVSDSGSNLSAYIGNPYYKVDQIGNHGFVRCSGASLNAIGLSEEIDRVNAFLGAGIYVE